MNKKNLKKYSGLSMIMGGVILLSGCGQVSTAVDNKDVAVEVIDNTVTSNPKLVVSTMTSTTKSNTTTSVSFTTKFNTTTVLTSTTSLATTSVKNEEELFANAGYGYKESEKEVNKENVNSNLDEYTNILYNTVTMSMDGKYAYSKYAGYYKITNDDSIQDVCDKFNITVNELYSKNPNLGGYGAGTVIAYPVMEELYLGHIGDDIKEISVETGVDIDTIMSNNILNLSGSTLKEESYILLHKFVGDENSYVTNKGVVNIINNNRIFGDKVVNACGFTGASNHFLALNESVYNYGVNDVVFYTFYDDSYKSETICNNAKDIICVDGIPVAILRNESDIKKIADSVNVTLDDMAYMQWESSVCDGYSICTSGDNSYVIMNGMEMDDLDLGKGYTKTK